MDLTYVKKLIKILTTSAIDEIEIEEEGKRIRISKNIHNNAASVPQSGMPQSTMTMPPSPTALQSPTPSVPTPSFPAVPEAAPEKKYHDIKSPIVGTFYRAPAPDADSYVNVGQVVQQGTVLCIIEAMKLMNEIESDTAGRIVKIHVENAQPVEYNQVLFSIEPM